MPGGSLPPYETKKTPFILNGLTRENVFFTGWPLRQYVYDSSKLKPAGAPLRFGRTLLYDRECHKGFQGIHVTL